MKITRTFNGGHITVELTPEELRTAYFEQQEIFDYNDCENGFELAYGDEDWYVDIINDPVLYRRILTEMALVHRRNLDNDCDLSHSSSMDMATWDDAVRYLIDLRERS